MLTMGASSSPLAALASKASLLAEQLGTGLYTGCVEVDLFPSLAETIRMKHAYWTAQVKKYGPPGENLVAPMVQAATKKLREEETRLRKLHSSCYMQCFAGSRFMFPKDLATSIQGVIDVLENLPLLLKDQSYDDSEDDISACARWSITRDVEGYSKLISKPDFEEFDEKPLLADQQQMNRASKQWGTRSRLPFSAEKQCLTLDSAMADVQHALERGDGPHLVVVHGGPGTGKSSLAKRVALHYENRLLNGTTQPPFSDGVFYLSCSGGVDIKAKQLELLYILGYPFHLLLTSGESQHLNGAEIHKKLVEYMDDRSALVVLDNVEECGLLQHLLVPSPRVKYLVTSDVKLPWADTLNLKVPPLEMDEARKILAHHLDLDPPPGSSETAIPSRLQVVLQRSPSILQR